MIMTIHIREKKTKVWTKNASDRKTRLKGFYLSNPLYSQSYNHYHKKHETQTIWTAVWSNEKPLKYNDRNEARVKEYQKSKKHYIFQKSNHFYDFFGQKVIIMTKK